MVGHFGDEKGYDRTIVVPPGVFEVVGMGRWQRAGKNVRYWETIAKEVYSDGTPKYTAEQDVVTVYQLRMLGEVKSVSDAFERAKNVSTSTRTSEIEVEIMKADGVVGLASRLRGGKRLRAVGSFLSSPWNKL